MVLLCSQHILTAMRLIMFGVDLGIMFPGPGQILNNKHRGNGTYGYAKAAVDTCAWINKRHFHRCVLWFISSGMNAIHRANINTSRVLTAGFCDHEGHTMGLSSSR